MVPVLEPAAADCELTETQIDVSKPDDSCVTTSRQSRTSAAAADDDDDDGSVSLRNTANVQCSKLLTLPDKGYHPAVSRGSVFCRTNDVNSSPP